MISQMNKTRRFLCILSIFLASISAMGDFFVVPFFSNFYKDFAGNEALVNFLVSGPTLIGFFSSLLSAPLIKKFNSKFVLLLGTLLCAVGGTLGVAVYSIYYVAAMRILVGAAMGFNMVASVVILNELFEDEEKRSWILGLFYSFEAIFGVLISLVVGRIAPDSWKLTFNGYWVLVPILIMIMLFVPSIKRNDASGNEVSNESKSSAKMSLSTLVILCLATMLVQILFNSFFLLSSVYVEAKGIGGSGASSICSSLVTAGTTVIGFAFAKMYSTMKRGITVLIFILMGIGYTALFVFTSLAATYLASILIGIADGLAMSFFPMYISTLAPADKVERYQSVNQGIFMVGVFLSTYAVSFIVRMINADSMLGALPVLAIVSAACAAIAVILILTKKPAVAE